MRFGAEPALAGPDPGNRGLAGVRVGTAGRAVADPVDRPEPGQVVGVAGVQLRPQPADLAVSSRVAASTANSATTLSRRPSSAVSSRAWLAGTWCGTAGRLRPR